MKSLHQISQENPVWTLDAFVQVANKFLPQFLPSEKAHTRVREEVSPRLIRHYTSQGLLDEPQKVGREARYCYRHLLLVLLVRRLLTEGYGANAIDSLARSKSNSDLEALLEGGIQLTIAPANPALAFLQQIQQRQSHGLASPSAAHVPPKPDLDSSGRLPQPAAPPIPPTHWIRLQVLPGLELHVRSDFVVPSTSKEQQNLLHHLFQMLLTLSSAHRRPPKS